MPAPPRTFRTPSRGRPTGCPQVLSRCSSASGRRPSPPDGIRSSARACAQATFAMGFARRLAALPVALAGILAVGGAVVAGAWTDAAAPSSGAAAAKLPDLPWRPSEGLGLIGTPAPAWVGVEWIRGGPLTLERLRGKVVLLRFWLTGCAYCTRTAPALNRLYRTHAARGLVVVGLHHPKSEETRSPDVVRQAADRLGFEFPV